MNYGSLKIKFPNGQTREFKLEHPTIFIGQADGNELVLEDRSVSRRHARFSVESGKLTVEDLGSSNGTLVGEQRLAPNKAGQVSKDQVVRLGQVEIQYLPPDEDDDDDQSHSQGRKLMLAISLAGVMAIIALLLFGGSAAAYFVLCPTYFPNLPFCSRPKPVVSLTPTPRPSATPTFAEKLTQTPTPTIKPTEPSVTPSALPVIPPDKDAVSLNCDDTYQRLRSDLGSAKGDQIWAITDLAHPTQPTGIPLKTSS